MTAQLEGWLSDARKEKDTADRQVKEARGDSERGEAVKRSTKADEQIQKFKKFLAMSRDAATPTVLFGPLWICAVLLFFVLPIIGTIRGWRSLAVLRRRPPPRQGAFAAMFAAWLCPLVACDAIIVVLWTGPAAALHGPWEPFAMTLALSLAAVTCLVADVWLVRRTWLWLHKT